MKKVLILFCLIIMASIMGCSSTDKVEKVTVYKMLSFSKIKPNSQITFTETKIVNEFVEAIDTASKELGSADMSDPHYKIELGEETFFLWLFINKQENTKGTLMNTNDTHTTYSLSERSAENIQDLLK
jgi:hypothetical protein